MNLGSTRRRTSLVLAALAGLAGGCGYHFAASGSGLPSGAETIYVARFGNHSRITGLNDQFARYLKDEIAAHRRLRLVDDAALADLQLSGEIVSDETGPSTFNSVFEPTQFNEQLFVSATLRDSRTQKTVWSASRLGASEFYAAVPESVVTTSPQFLEQNLRARDVARLPGVQLAETQRSSAQDQAMSELARTLYASMSEGF